MANIFYIRGKAYWAKVLGDPVMNYNKDGKEWKLDFAPNEDGLELIEKLGIKDRLKTDKNANIPGPYLSLKQAEYRKPDKEGIVKKNDPIKVVDPDNQPWDQTKLIGNGTDVDVKIEVIDYGVGKFSGVYIRGLRVLKLVKYESKEFPALTPDDEFFAREDVVPDDTKGNEEAKKPEPDNELDDDLPF